MSGTKPPFDEGTIAIEMAVYPVMRSRIVGIARTYMIAKMNQIKVIRPRHPHFDVIARSTFGMVIISSGWKETAL